MIYEDPATGRVHSLSAEKTMAFIKSTEHNAKLVNTIADKAKQAIDAKWQLDQPDQQIGTATANLFVHAPLLRWSGYLYLKL